MDQQSSSTSSMDDVPPEHFICPLTLQVMDDPVQHIVTKHNYERGAILHWVYYGNGTCPLTRKPLDPSDFVDNNPLQQEIRAWRGEGVESSVQYPEVAPTAVAAASFVPKEQKEQDEDPVACTPTTKKEKAILRRLQKLRQNRTRKTLTTVTSTKACQC